MSTLKRTQMYIHEDMLTKLKKKADEEKTTVASIVRNAVSDFFGREKVKDWAKDPLWSMVGASSSKEKDPSVNHDKYLYGKGK